MPSTLMERFLKQNEGRWAEAATVAASAKGYSEKPDGRYIGQISYADIVESESSGKLQIAWRATIMEGDLQGELIYWWEGLENERSLEFVAKNLAKFGYDPTTVRLRDLPKILAAIVEKEPVCQLRLKTKPGSDFQNCWVDRVLEDYVPDDEGDEEHNARMAAKAAAEAEAEAAAAKPVKPSSAKAKPVATPTPEPAPKAKPGPKPKPTPASLPEPEEDEEDEDEDEDEEDEVDLEIGMMVSFEKGGKTLTGKVTKIDENSETATVKVGIKSYPVSFEDMEVVETDG